MKIALSFGLLNAVMPLVVAAVAGKPPLTLALGAGWVGAWLVAIALVNPLRRVLADPVGRSVLFATCAAATGATILSTGGTQSAVANGANWLGWAATVVVARGTALRLSVVLSLGTTLAYLIEQGSVRALFDDDTRYVAVTGLLNPPVIVLVALALQGVFHAVVAASPGTLWKLRNGGPATTPGLTTLLGNPPIALLTSADRAPSPTTAPTDAITADDAPELTADERRVVELLADGLVPKEVARLIDRAPTWVYSRIASAKRKTNARTIEHLVALTWKPTA